ncbi:phospholipase C type enzyme [Pestalotiopsis sp. 9143b]|nr:phospholipase C type enzyme [Pestalotiopsis sp. 9143b]
MDELPSELTELNILTLNCWGLLYLSAERTTRLQVIGHTIGSTTPTPHIVALQECWTQDDYLAIRRATRFILPYGKFYHSGAFGGGLAILSKWPIEESSMVQYPLNGRPTAFFRGDWFVGKGVACAKIRFGSGPRDVVEVFNTHTHPSYEHGTKCTYTAHRLSQAWELSKLLRGAAARGHLVLAVGDFNATPMSLMHRIVTSHSTVKDVWRVLHPDSSVGAADDDLERARRRPVPTAEYNIHENGATSDTVYNTWRWPKSQRRLLGKGRQDEWPQIAPDSLDPKGKRLDYIFASSGLAENEESDRAWVVHDARVGMMGRHPELGCSLSDHFSVEATLVLHRSDPSRPSSSSPDHYHHHHQQDRSAQYGHNLSLPGRPAAAVSLAETRATDIPNSDLENGVYLQSPSTSETHLPAPATKPQTPRAQLQSSYAAQLAAAAQPAAYLPPGAYDEILAEIRAYAAREKFQRRWRGVHFATWLVVAVICYVGVWWTPRYVSFILMVLSSLGLAAGVVDGLIALLFVGAELRALREFEWEVENARMYATAAERTGTGAGLSSPAAVHEDEPRRSFSREGSREKS